MPDFVSLRQYGWGILKYLWPFFVFAYLDASDLLQKLISNLSPKAQRQMSFLKDVPLEIHGLVWLLVLFFASLKIFHDIRVKVDTASKRKQKLLHLIGEEMDSGVNKCIYFMNVATEGAFNFDILSTSLNRQLANEFYTLDDRGRASRAIRRIYEMFETINHNIKNEVGIKMVSDKMGKEMRSITVPGWCKTYILEMIECHDVICDEFALIKDDKYIRVYILDDRCHNMM